MRVSGRVKIILRRSVVTQANSTREQIVINCFKAAPGRILWLWLVIFVFFSGNQSFGQSHTMNGIGDVIFDEAGMTIGMGGVGVGLLKERNFSKRNPAVLAVTTRSVYVVGLRMNDIYFSSPNYGAVHSRRTRLGVSQVIISLPLKIRFGWGLSPFSRIDFRGIRSGSYGVYTYEEEIIGKGDLNISAFTLAREVGERLFLGLGVDYVFGNIRENWRKTYQNYPIGNTTYFIRKRFSGVAIRIGGAMKLTEKLSSGIYFQTKTPLTEIIEASPDSVAGNYIRVEKTHFSLPPFLGCGVVYEIRDGFDIGADFSYGFWKNAHEKSPKGDRFRDSYEFGAGIRYISSTSIRASYIEKIPFTAGLKYRGLYYESYPKRSGVIERLVSFGIELPVTDEGGSLHITVDLGKRGYVTKNGWRENIVRLHMSFVGVLY